jgi:hypothetical protein
LTASICNFFNQKLFHISSKIDIKKEVIKMAGPKIDQEIILHTKNEIGILAKIFVALSNSRVNVEALCAFGEKDNGTFLIYTFDHEKAKKALESAGYEVNTEEVVVATLANRVGAAEEMTNKIAQARINVKYCYGSTGDGKHTLFIISTENNSKALKALKHLNT